MSTPAWAGYAESQGAAQGDGGDGSQIGVPGQQVVAKPIVRRYTTQPTNSRNTFRLKVFKTSEGHFS